jgi:hypothetical protein
MLSHRERESRTEDTHDTSITFVKHLIILTQRDEEHQCHHNNFETVNPLLPLTPLPTHIKQLICQLADFERRLRDTGRLLSWLKDTLIGRHIIEVIYGGIVELEFARAADGFFDIGVTPEVGDAVGDVAGEDVGFKLGRDGEDDGAVDRCSVGSARSRAGTSLRGWRCMTKATGERD